MPLAYHDIAFTPEVVALQEKNGSAAAYAKYRGPEYQGGDEIGPQEAQFIHERDGFFQATVSSSGWPYVQFRGGRPGFLRVLDSRTIAFGDLRGNRQYISTGNLSGDDRVALILVDYPNQRRLKVLGHVDIRDPADHPDLTETLRMEGTKQPIERLYVIKIAALDWNCPQHIPQRFTLSELEPVHAEMRNQIAALQAEIEALRAQLKS
ncbi:hypothetical protein ACMU_11315 [Actibacterium mucosum KCTC 23349]|uniref:Pyridoxamine 5'-phosphate oxidase N-terminal domain-containing protein n=1 Tax=Actibacterium mucosum KCTC 23349 TaxID=1454373 RepID=A0A037ZIA2_9RHOB|nr:pyridoxamine 5'-phosphate oxidase family protein [Actibacterium mucosum]KAJ55282.1 hypothetical protein ACMU_11315 [Actibacterium mucosum KCTC 23349]